jgi:hypothetical protein
MTTTPEEGSGALSDDDIETTGTGGPMTSGGGTDSDGTDSDGTDA